MNRIVSTTRRIMTLETANRMKRKRWFRKGKWWWMYYRINGKVWWDEHTRTQGWWRYGLMTEWVDDAMSWWRCSLGGVWGKSRRLGKQLCARWVKKWKMGGRTRSRDWRKDSFSRGGVSVGRALLYRRYDHHAAAIRTGNVLKSCRKVPVEIGWTCV